MIGDPETCSDGWLDNHMPYLLYRATNRLNARLQSRLKAAGVSGSHWRVISVLRSYGRLNITQIVDLTLMEQPTVSRVVAQLETRNWIVRRAGSDDMRMTEVILTDEGRRRFELILPSARLHEEMALKGFSASDLKVLRALLARIETNIDDYT